MDKCHIVGILYPCPCWICKWFSATGVIFQEQSSFLHRIDVEITCFKPFLRSRTSTYFNHVQKSWLFLKNNFCSGKPFTYSTWARMEDSNDMTFIHVTSIIKKFIFFIFIFSFSSSIFWKNKCMGIVVLFTFFSTLKEVWKSR